MGHKLSALNFGGESYDREAVRKIHKLKKAAAKCIKKVERLEKQLKSVITLSKEITYTEEDKTFVQTLVDDSNSILQMCKNLRTKIEQSYLEGAYRKIISLLANNKGEHESTVTKERNPSENGSYSDNDIADEETLQDQTEKPYITTSKPRSDMELIELEKEPRETETKKEPRETKQELKETKKQQEKTNKAPKETKNKRRETKMELASLQQRNDARKGKSKSKKIGYVQILDKDSESLGKDVGQDAVKELITMLHGTLNTKTFQLKVIHCREPSRVKYEIPLLVICFDSSRIGTDVLKAIDDIHDFEKTMVLIFHHTKRKVNPTKQDLKDPKLNLKIRIHDFAFFEGQGVYECETNDTSKASVVGFIRDYYHKKIL